MLFDTHVHFDDTQGDYSSAALIGRARLAGVTRMVAVGGSDTANRAALDAARRFPDAVAAAVGFDREHARACDKLSEANVERAMSNGERRSVEKALRELLAKAAGQGIGVAAVGEIGLDFHYHPDTAEAQIDLFRAQLALACEMALPVVVHSRNADAETMRELALHAQRHAALAERLGVLHCFTGGQKFAGQLLELGYFLSFSGIVTFRNAGALRAVARTVPDARLLIETDTPYLAPVPVRGQRNEPAFLPYVAAALAEARGGSAERIAAVTAENAARVFGGMGAVHTTKDTKST